MASDAWAQVAAAARAEAERLAALQSLALLDTPSEASFDRVAHLAARLFAAPIALVSLIDAERQWFKAAVGLTAAETPRCDAFCNRAIRSPEVFVVPDARRDPRFAANPYVIGEPHVVFYAGAPLSVGGGPRIGTLCIIDHRPRDDFGAEDRAALADLAALLVEAAELRRLRLAEAPPPHR